MKTVAIRAIIFASIWMSATCAHADKYHVTANEKAACTGDAIRLCLNAYPNEDKLIACMKANRNQLSSVCQVAFDAGVRRRRL